jgi:hypothetical protein
MSHIVLTRGGLLCAVLPNCKYARNGHDSRNGTSSNGTAVLQETETNGVEVPAIWEEGYGGEVTVALTAFAVARERGKYEAQALNRCLNALKVLRRGLGMFVASQGNVGSKLKRRVAALREIPKVLLRYDTSGGLVVSKAEIEETIRLIERLIGDLRNNETLTILRQRKTKQRARRTKLNYIRHKRRLREKSHKNKRRNVANERTRLTRFVTFCKERLWTGGEFVAQSDGNNGHPVNGVGNGENNGDSNTVVASLPVLKQVTTCGQPCNGCHLAGTCSHAADTSANATGVVTDTSANAQTGGVSSDVTDLFHPDGSWKELGGGG